MRSPFAEETTAKLPCHSQHFDRLRRGIRMDAWIPEHAPPARRSHNNADIRVLQESPREDMTGIQSH